MQLAEEYKILLALIMISCHRMDHVFEGQVDSLEHHTVKAHYVMHGEKIGFHVH